MIRRTRKMQSMSQEELAFGICSVSTLSRIENGLETPGRATLEKMLERLAGKGSFLQKNPEETKAYSLRHLFVRNIIRNSMDDKGQILNEYTTGGRDDAFVCYVKALESYDEDDFDKCEKLIEKTLSFKGIKIDSKTMDYLILEPFEMHALVIFAGCYKERKEYDKARALLGNLKKYMEESSSFDGLHGEMYIFILSEYADLLVKKGDYSEALAMCALALNEMECRGRTFLKRKVFDIKARAYEKKGQQELEAECR
jgi:transcriptional regulator with XRE-family HTH domain